jgi:hypothetical protein
MMEKTFKLYVIDDHWVPGTEYGVMLGIVAENEDDAFKFLSEWTDNYCGVSGFVPEKVLHGVLTRAKVFDILGTDVEAGVNFQFVT